MTGKRITVFLDDELHDRAEAYAEHHDRTLSNLIRHALRQFMRRYPQTAEPVQDSPPKRKAEEKYL